MSDNINPDHYKSQTSLECIDAMEIAFGYEGVAYFCLCNAFKYIWRWKNKNGTEDLKKAEWYLKKADELTDRQEIFFEDFEIIDRMKEYTKTMLATTE